MKRRSQTATHPQPKPTKSNPKSEPKAQGSGKGSNKSKQVKSTHDRMARSAKNKPEEDYVMIDGNIYKADTNTERVEVNMFVNRFKRRAIYEKPIAPGMADMDQGGSSRVVPAQGPVPVEELVKQLPMEQKISLMKQLERQIGVSNPQFQQSGSSSLENNKSVETEDNSTEKYNILNIKLSTLEQQLQVKRETQLQKINRLFYEGELTASERRHKITSIDKVKDKKLKIINCTRNLFYTLLHNKFEADLFRQNHSHIDEAIKQLDSFSELDPIVSENSISLSKPKNEAANVPSETSMSSDHEFDKIQIMGVPELKLDKFEDRVEGSDKKSLTEDSLLLSPDKNVDKSAEKQPEKQQEVDKFECTEESLTKKLRIPLLLTKQRLEQIQWQKKARAIQTMKAEIHKKISFQMSEIHLEEIPVHFTTMFDVNTFIMALEQFLMKNDLDNIFDKLKIPYGKTVADKLFYLQREKIEAEDEMEYITVLDEAHFEAFVAEYWEGTRKAQIGQNISEFERIHYKAIFDSFNKFLDNYRPYFDLNGEVYPWKASEKAISFYDIDENNIEELFEATKIKVLECCTPLCGIIPFNVEKSEAPMLLEERNNQAFRKEERQSLYENFPLWAYRVDDFEVRVRLQISEEIIFSEICSFVIEMQNRGLF